jgi:hypothetical protein
MRKQFLHFTILILLVCSCKTTKISETPNTVASTEGSGQAGLTNDTATNPSNIQNNTADTVKVLTHNDSINKCIGCKNLSDSFRNGYVRDIGLMGGKPSYLHVIKNVPPILTKVFPDVVFLQFESIGASGRSSSRNVAINGSIYDLRSDFNTVYNLVKHKNDISFEDKVHAAIQIIYNYDNSVNIKEIEKKDTSMNVMNSIIYFNYKVSANIDGRFELFLVRFFENNIYVLNLRSGRDIGMTKKEFYSRKLENNSKGNNSIIP